MQMSRRGNALDLPARAKMSVESDPGDADGKILGLEEMSAALILGDDYKGDVQ